MQQSGLKYRENAVWNKAMIARILDCEKYISEQIPCFRIAGRAFPDDIYIISMIDSNKLLSAGLAADKISYSSQENAVWNKAMIARILDCEKYISEEFPAILPSDLFLQVQRLRKDRAQI